jgi:hypothetical protein
MTAFVGAQPACTGKHCCAPIWRHFNYFLVTIFAPD